MANIPAESGILWLHSVIAVVFVLVALYSIYWDLNFYFQTRQRYRVLPTTDHCSVMVIKMDPKSLKGRTEEEKKEDLRQYYDSLFPGSVKYVHLVRHDPELIKLVDKRAAMKPKLERAVARSEQGKQATHTLGFCCFGKKVESIPYYTEQIQQLRYHHSPLFLFFLFLLFSFTWSYSYSCSCSYSSFFFQTRDRIPPGD